MMRDEHITRAIIGSAYRVHNTLAFGFLESVYERSLAIELAKRGLKAEARKALTEYYTTNLKHREVFHEVQRPTGAVLGWRCRSIYWLAALPPCESSATINKIPPDKQDVQAMGTLHQSVDPVDPVQDSLLRNS